jgi:hypothetical protein
MVANQTAKDFWARMVSVLKQTPLELQTVHLNGTDGLWLLASVENSAIRINDAVNHQPSVNTSKRLYETEFIKLFPRYDEWKNGKIQRNKLQAESHKTSYIFALIEYFKE